MVTVIIYEDSRYKILIVVCEIYHKEVIINILKLPMPFFQNLHSNTLALYKL